MEFIQKLNKTNDSLEFVVHSGDQSDTALTNLLMVYSKLDVISAQYPISFSKAEICETEGYTQLTILSIRKQNGDFLLQHSWRLDGHVGDKLIRFFVQIGLPAEAINDPLKWEYSEGNYLLNSRDRILLKHTGESLSLSNEFTHSFVHLDDLGVNILHQDIFVKLELHYINSGGLYAGWFFSKSEFNALVKFFREIGYRIENPDPMNFHSNG